MNSITGEEYTAIKTTLYNSLVELKKGQQKWLNRICDCILLNYIISNFDDL